MEQATIDQIMDTQVKNTFQQNIQHTVMVIHDINNFWCYCIIRCLSFASAVWNDFMAELSQYLLLSSPLPKLQEIAGNKSMFMEANSDGSMLNKQHRNQIFEENFTIRLADASFA